MPKLNDLPYRETQRSDTLGLRTFVKYDPMAPRASTPVMVGKYVVARKPLHGSVHTLYMIMDGAEIARAPSSYPSEADCATALSSRRRAVTPIAKAVAAKKEGWKARSIATKEAA